MLQSLLKFTNPHRPYAAHAPQAYPHPFLLCVWRPAGSEAPAPPPRRWEPLAIEALPKTSPLYEDRADLEPLAARAPPGDTSAPFSAVGAAVCARVEARMERAKRLRIKTRRERV